MTGYPDRLPGDWMDAVRSLDHGDTRLAALAERAFLDRLDGSCRTPMAAHLTIDGTRQATIRGAVYDPSGAPVWTEVRTSSLPENADEAQAAAIELGRSVGGFILEAAGHHLPKIIAGA